MHRATDAVGNDRADDPLHLGEDHSSRAPRRLAGRARGGRWVGRVWAAGACSSRVADKTGADMCAKRSIDMGAPREGKGNQLFR